MNSTQKLHWTFREMDELTALRVDANRRLLDKYRTVVDGDEEEEAMLDAFFTQEEEFRLCRIVAETGLK